MPLPSRDEVFHALGLAAADGGASIRTVFRSVADRYMDTEAARAYVEAEIAGVVDEYGKHMQRATAGGARAYATVDPTRTTHVVPIQEEGPLVFTARARQWLLSQPWRDFETLVANALAALPQAEGVFLGRGTQDFGMDFVVRWNPEAKAGNPQGYRGPTIFDGTPTFLYGQCKRYGIGHNVGRPDVQRLTGSLAMLQGHAGGVRAVALREELTAWGWTPDAPHYLAFATTARFPLDWQKRDFPNLIKMDGEHVAQSLLNVDPRLTWPDAQTTLEALRTAQVNVQQADLPADD